MRLITRSGLDWTQRYGDLAEAFAALPCREAVIDGEIVVLDEQGDQPLRAAAGRACQRGAATSWSSSPSTSSISTAGTSRGVPLVKRKELLRAAAGGAVTGALGDPVQRPRRRRRRGASTSRRREMGLEGIVSKRAVGALPAGPLEDLGQDQGAQASATS